MDRGRAYKPSGKNCSLCDLEKFYIIFKPELASLIKETSWPLSADTEENIYVQ